MPLVFKVKDSAEFVEFESKYNLTIFLPSLSALGAASAIMQAQVLEESIEAAYTAGHRKGVEDGFQMGVKRVINRIEQEFREMILI